MGISVCKDDALQSVARAHNRATMPFLTMLNACFWAGEIVLFLVHRASCRCNCLMSGLR